MEMLCGLPTNAAAEYLLAVIDKRPNILIPEIMASLIGRRARATSMPFE